MTTAELKSPETSDKDALLAWLQRGVLGAEARIDSPIREQPVRYFDYIASGRPFGPIEEILARDVLPYMANTHSESSALGRRMSHLYDRAHEKVARYLNAAEDDVVIFTGSGSTGAINHLIYALGLRLPQNLAGRFPRAARCLRSRTCARRR